MSNKKSLDNFKVCKQSVDNFKIGSWVVYPIHGVGLLKDIDTMTIAGSEISFFVIVFKKNKLVLKLPVQKAIDSGLRNVASKDDLQSIFDTLSTKATRKKIVWSKRFQEYNSKLKSGSLQMVAEVIRDIYRDGGILNLSFSERQIYYEAVERLAKEISIIEDTAEGEVMQKIEKALAA